MRDRGPARLTKNLLSTLSRVNVSVNRAVKPMNDIDIFGKDEVWSYPDGVGDCEDYVLEKRRLLQGKGVSLTNLLITVVRKPDGEGHAVLTVRTDKGDFILDNLRDDIRPWSKTGYRFLKRQASNHTGRWVNLHAERNRFVGSVNR
jgi:predicted transglutaminase-like cysteine proteinase